MRILVLHSPYLTGSLSGENRVVEDEVRLLRSAGHEVDVWLPDRHTGTPTDRAREALAAVWARDAAAEVMRRVRELQPDVVHCHNLFPALSPAVLRAVGGSGTRLVMTLHNYRLLCLPAVFLRDRAICEDCLGRTPWRGVVHRCYRGSLAGSAALATSLTVHRRLGTFDRVDLYLATSEFVRSKHVEAGFDGAHVAVKPNFAWSTARNEEPGDYLLFAGRLSPEKDVRTVLEAIEQARLPLVVVGDGPDAEALRRDAPGNVTFRGAVEPDELPPLVAGARALVLPSISYEGSPRSVVEAYAAGVPAVANRIGAVPEVVVDGETGLLVPPRDPAALAEAFERIADETEQRHLAEGAFRAWTERYSPEVALRALESAYRG